MYFKREIGGALNIKAQIFRELLFKHILQNFEMGIKNKQTQKSTLINIDKKIIFLVFVS